VVRVAREPFGIRESIADLTDQEGKPLSKRQEKVKAPQRHNLVTKNPVEEGGCPTYPSGHSHKSIPFRRGDEAVKDKVLNALSGTKNNCSPGPD